MPSPSRRQWFGALLIGFSALLLVGAFFVRVRRLALLATVLLGIGAMLVTRRS